MREELSDLLETLPEDDLRQVRDFVKVLLKTPEELSGEEIQEAQQGDREFQRGDWVKWDEIKRQSV